MSPHLTEQKALDEFNYAAERIDAFGCENFEGRGIVICGGGLRYFTCAWVCINMLRWHGCRLPVQLWHLGDKELSDCMRGLLTPLGVECVDAQEIAREHPARILNGWELKPFALIHSRFREILLMDADNVAVTDPGFLFETQQYRQAGAIFWPDYGRLSPTRSIWRLTGVPYRDEPEFETGQIVIDKARCLRALSLTMWMNEHSDFWYRHVHGDKETFHMAWRKLQQPYVMPARGIEGLDGTMCQHDFEGRRIFQHRNLLKWRLGHNIRVHGFQFEDECLRFIDRLRLHERKLIGLPWRNVEEQQILSEKIVDYRRVGIDSRRLTMESDGTVGEGQNCLERFWQVTAYEGRRALEIYGDDGLTARLFEATECDGVWRGSWVIHERMPVEIVVM